MKKIMIAFAAIAAMISGAFAAPSPWFNGTIGSESGGAWTVPDDGSVTTNSTTLVVDDPETALEFAATDKYAAGDAELTISNKVKFMYAYDSAPDVPSDAKAGIVVVVQNATTNYWVLAKDSTTNTWVNSNIAAGDLTAEVAVNVFLTNIDSQVSAVYTIGTSEITKSIAADTSYEFNTVGYLGCGEIASSDLVGTVTRHTVNYTIDSSAFAAKHIASVAIEGLTAVTNGSSIVYAIPCGDAFTVVYTAGSGYVFAGNSLTKSVAYASGIAESTSADLSDVEPRTAIITLDIIGLVENTDYTVSENVYTFTTTVAPKLYKDGVAQEVSGSADSWTWTKPASVDLDTLFVVMKSVARTAPAHKWYENPKVIATAVQTYCEDGSQGNTKWSMGVGENYFATPYGWGSSNSGFMIFDVNAAEACTTGTFTPQYSEVKCESAETYQHNFQGSVVLEQYGRALIGSRYDDFILSVPLQSTNGLLNVGDACKIYTDNSKILCNLTRSADGYVYGSEDGQRTIYKYQIVSDLHSDGTGLKLVATYEEVVDSTVGEIRSFIQGNIGGTEYIFISADDGNVYYLDCSSTANKAASLGISHNKKSNLGLAGLSGSEPHLYVYDQDKKSSGDDLFAIYKLTISEGMTATKIKSFNRTELAAIYGVASISSGGCESFVATDDEATLFMGDSHQRNGTSEYVRMIQYAPYSVKFAMNDGTSDYYGEAQDVDIGGKATRPTADPVRADYIFVGWYADASGQSEFSFNDVITADTTIYAKWRYPNIAFATVEHGKIETSVTNSVAPGTVVTVTATADTNWNLESIKTNDAAIAGTTFTMPATDVTIGATFVEGIPGPQGTDPVPMKEAEAYAEKTGYDLKDPEQKAEFEQKMASTSVEGNQGRTFYESVVLGVGTNEELAVSCADTNAADKLSFALASTPVDGLATYTLMKDGKAVEGQSGKSSPVFENVDFADGEYLITAQIKGDNKEIIVAKKFGVKTTTGKTANTTSYCNVPYTAGDGAGVAIGDLFKKAMLVNGDQIDVYDSENNNWKTFQYNGTEWAGVEKSGSTPSAAETKLVRGQAFKFTRPEGASANPAYLGYVAEGNAQVSAPAGKFTLMAKTDSTAFKLSTDSASEKDHALVLESDGAPKARYQKKNGKWYKVTWSNGKTDATETTEVDAGDAFFYLNNGSSEKNVEL